MGRLSVVNFVSIDGVVQSPLSQDEDRDGGFDHGGWAAPYSDDVLDQFMRDSTIGASGMLLGRRSYEILRTAWAEADEREPARAGPIDDPPHELRVAGAPHEVRADRHDADLVGR